MHRGSGLKDAPRLSNILDMDSLLHANVLKKVGKQHFNFIFDSQSGQIIVGI